MFTYPPSEELNRLVHALSAAGIRISGPRQTGMYHLSVPTSDYEAAWKIIREDPYLRQRFAEYAPPAK